MYPKYVTKAGRKRIIIGKVIHFYKKILGITAFAVLGAFCTDVTAQVKNAGGISPNQLSSTWSINPFDNKVFIENAGQFNIADTSKSKALFSATLGNVKLYFTANGIVYSYTDYKQSGADKTGKPTEHHLTAEWENANPNVTVTAELQQSYCNYFPAGNKGSIKASVFKKLVYHNIYQGIDIEYYFPLGKEGFEYDIVVHPGADVSNVKLKYTGATSSFADAVGNILLNTPVGEITDHAPNALDAGGKSVKVKYVLNEYEECFKISGNYDKSKDLVIDPWTTDPKFTGVYDKAYDLRYDFNGNIYVYGAYNYFQLVKLNSVGTIQWKFSASTIDPAIYGGLAVDPVSGTSYLVEGAKASGARILKVNAAGALVATSASDAKMNEMWRPLFNTCNHNIIIGAGGTNSDFQATIVDTSFTSFNNLNVLGAAKAGHSIVLSALDPSGSSCYMAAAKSAVIDPLNFNNVLIKLPLPTLTPTTYVVQDGFKFVELASVSYVATGIGSTNGMNGMAASLNWLYLYDGGELRRVNKTTGTIIDSIKVTANPYSCGGLDADICDNVYAGSNKWISVYNSSLALADTINMPDTVYDVRIGPNRQVIYACGRGFVRSVNVPFSPLSIASTNATCSCNGTATANLCGGSDTSSVTYLWSNGQTTQTITGLCGGKYKVTVTLGGCTPTKYFDSVIITQPPVLVAAITSKSNVKCNGGFGNATVGVTGGATPYTYSWSPSGGTNATADTLYPGSYTMTVRDANGCTATTAVTITQPPVLKDTATSTFAHCAKSDGSVNVTVTGGTIPYTYSWAPIGKTTATVNGLPAGGYIITVTDSNGCIVNATTIVSDSGVSPVIKALTAEKCFGQKVGSATVSMTGGTPGYTYSWAPSGQTTDTAKNLAGGTYIATVTDSKGCVVSDTVTIMQPNLLVINMEPGNVSCHGGANGSITAAVTGGTSPYTYAWSPVTGTDSTISGLTTGQYSVSVSDINGCSASDTITITQPTNGLIAAIEQSNPVTCNGGKNGSATAGAMGGTGPYNFNWAPSGGADSTADSLSAGTYTATVTDSHGCSTTVTVVIAQPSKVLGDSIVTKNNKCDGDTDGMAFVIVSGGTKPYTYSWFTGATRDTIQNLASGTYNVTILDSNKCQATGSATITQPPPLIIATSSTPTPCNRNAGTATVTVSGEPFTYSWSPIAGTDSTLTGVGAGSYTATITDTSGCKTTTVVTVPNSVPPKVTASTLPATCDSTNGSAIAHATGGVGTYTYLWSPSLQTTDTAKRIGPGIYTVTVTDTNGCVGKAITIVGDSGITASFGSVQNVTCNGLADGSATAGIVGGTGPYSYAWSPGGQTTATINNLGVSTYTVIITDVHNCVATDTITITQPAVLTAAIPAANITGVSCSGGNNGQAIVNVSGGTQPYSYSWTDGEKGDTANKLSAGNYTVTVTDFNGCTATATVAMTEPTALTVTAGTTAATCGNNGSATATAHGGTSPYVYNWAGYGGGATISGIGPGDYTVTAIDANGCNDTAVAVVIHSGQSASISASKNVTCFGGNNGSTTVSVVGGDTLLYAYSWTPGTQTNATATNLSAGIYTVYVTYVANGCTDTVYDTITQPSKITMALSDSVKCNSTMANTLVSVVGGIPGYTYKWSNGDSTSNVNLTSGNYTVTVTDAHGCKDSLTTKIITPPLGASFKPEPDTILGGEFVYFNNQSIGASSWFWTFGNGNSSDSLDPYQQYVTAGKYNVYLYIIDSRGCRDSVERTVYVIENLYIPNVFTPNGDGINDGFHITAGNMKVYDLLIFNRWGEQVFESKSPNNDWTGVSDAGVKCADGTYYYILKATDYENKTYNLDGFLQLIR